jgi:hypothetical protein
VVEELEVFLQSERDLCSGSGDRVVGTRVDVRGVAPLPTTTMAMTMLWELWGGRMCLCLCVCVCVWW